MLDVMLWDFFFHDTRFCWVRCYASFIDRFWNIRTENDTVVRISAALSAAVQQHRHVST